MIGLLQYIETNDILGLVSAPTIVKYVINLCNKSEEINFYDLLCEIDLQVLKDFIIDAEKDEEND